MEEAATEYMDLIIELSTQYGLNIIFAVLTLIIRFYGGRLGQKNGCKTLSKKRNNR